MGIGGSKISWELVVAQKIILFLLAFQRFRQQGGIKHCFIKERVNNKSENWDRKGKFHHREKRFKRVSSTATTKASVEVHRKQDGRYQLHFALVGKIFKSAFETREFLSHSE